MIAHQQATSALDLIAKIEGTQVAQGTAGTLTSGASTFQDLTTDAFEDVLVGDRIWVSTIPTPFVVATKPDNNNLTFTATAPSSIAATAKWKAKRGGIGSFSDLLMDPVYDGTRWHLFWESTTFSI